MKPRCLQNVCRNHFFKQDGLNLVPRSQLGPSWSQLEPTWGFLGPTRSLQPPFLDSKMVHHSGKNRPFGRSSVVLGAPGSSWGCYLAFLSLSASFWDHFGPILNRFGGGFGVSWLRFGTFLIRFWDSLAGCLVGWLAGCLVLTGLARWPVRSD